MRFAARLSHCIVQPA